MKPRPSRFQRFSISAFQHLFISCSLLAAVSTTAQAKTWIADDEDDALWTTAGNWDPSGAPATNAEVTFNGTGTVLNTTTGGAFTLNSISFTADQSSAVTINTTTTNNITFNPGTVLSVAAGTHRLLGTGTADANRDVVFRGTASTDSYTFDIASDASFEIAGRIGLSGSGASNRNYIKTGGGILILSGANGGGSGWNFSATGGGFTISQGALRLTNSASTGNTGNRFTVASGAALELAANFGSANGAQTISGTGINNTGAIRSLNGNRTFGVAGTSTGSLTLAANSAIGVDSGSLNIGLAIGQSGGDHSLTKVGDGLLILSNDNTYTGPTSIMAGILQIGDGTNDTGTLGNNSASNTFIAAGAELRINRTGTFGYDYRGELSGSGAVTIMSGKRMNFRTDQIKSGELAFEINGILAITTPDNVTAVELGELSGSGTIQRGGAAPTDPPTTLITIGGKNTDSVFTGNISNISEFAVEKVGTGTLTLGGNYGHGSGTTVTAGTLLVNGSLTSSANTVTVGTNGTLGGSGTIAGATTVAGNLTPGTSAGVLSFSSSLALAASSSTTMEIIGTGMVRGTDYDGIDVGTTLGLNGDLILDFGTTFTVGTYTFNLFEVVGSTSGDFASVALSGAYGDNPLTLDSGVWSGTTNSGNETWSFSQSTGNLSLTVIPEPRAALLGGLGLLLLLRRRRG